MARFYRFQVGHYELSEMQDYTSEDGGEGWEELGIEPEGICACTSASDLIRNTVWWCAADGEVVEFTGEKLMDIYDGVRVYPTSIIRYWTPAEFRTAYDAGEID